VLVYPSRGRSPEFYGPTRRWGRNSGPRAYHRTKLEQRVGKNWRIFHKVGWGDSTSRSRSEVVLASYACLPDFDGGHEFVLVLRTSVPLSSVQRAGEVAQTRATSIVAEALAAR